MNNFFFGNTQSNGNNSGSHNTIVYNYGTINGGVPAGPSNPEPPKRGPSPLLVKAALVIVVIALLVFAPHAAAVLPHVVEIIKAIL